MNASEELKEAESIVRMQTNELRKMKATVSWEVDSLNELLRGSLDAFFRIRTTASTVRGVSGKYIQETADEQSGKIKSFLNLSEFRPKKPKVDCSLADMYRHGKRKNPTTGIKEEYPGKGVSHG